MTYIYVPPYVTIWDPKVWIYKSQVLPGPGSAPEALRHWLLFDPLLFNYCLYVWNMCEICELLLNYISWSTSYTLVLRSIGPIGPLLDGLFSFLSRSNSLGPAASRGQCRPGFDSDLGVSAWDVRSPWIAMKAFWKIAMAYHFNILAISIPTFAGVLPKVLPFFMKPEQLRYIGGLFSSDRWYVELGLEKT